MTTDGPRAPSHVARARPHARAGQQRLARWCSIESPAAATSTSRSTRVGNESASSAATKPPIELPTTTAVSTPSASQQRVEDPRVARIEIFSRGIGDSPKPGQVGRDHPVGVHERGDVEQPVLPAARRGRGRTRAAAAPVAARVDDVDLAALHGAPARVIDGQSTAIQRRVVAVGVGGVRARAAAARSRSPPRAADASSARRGLPYQRPCGSPSTSTPPCTTTGTSSRPPPSAASASSCRTRSRSVADRPAAPRAGPRLRRRDAPRRADPAPPSPTRAPSRRSARGTRPATSSTSPRTATTDAHARHRALAGPDRAALRRALLLLRQGRALPRDRDRRADRRLARQPRSPPSSAGIAAATLAHPWNRDVCEEEDVVCAADWPGLGPRARARCSRGARR